MAKKNNSSSDDSDKNKGRDDELPFLTHLIELRDRLLRSVLVVLVIFVGLFYFANDIYTLLSKPLVAYLPEGGTMVAIDVITPFLTPLKLTIVVSLLIAMPYILYHAWGFIAPGLYQHERKLAFPLLVSSVLLFYAGIAFAYYVVFPLVFGFIATTVPEGIKVTPDISRSLDFMLKMFFAFGFAFEVPIATVLLVVTGMTTPEKLVAKRSYIIVGAFVFGMLLTPPDIISQIMLAVPMWLLFELGVVFSRIIKRRKEAAEVDEDNDDAQAANSEN